ncbi:MAG: biotin synthase BioB [Desulfuromonadales bacterium]|nr:biotin synthase BioB [Desulfuromonadales bacterium]
MDFQHKTNELLSRIESGLAPTQEQGKAILNAQGSELTALMAGAQFLRENAFGDSIHTCSIINAKSGLCQENCAFCAQSAHHEASVPVYPLKDSAEIINGAAEAAKQGAHCFGIVTSGTRPETDGEFQNILTALREINRIGDITPSASLGLLDRERAQALADAGCATYHHNLETSRSFFPQICSTHDYEEDLNTVRLAKEMGMKVCCGGILGLGESIEQRIELAETLRELEVDSVPLNFLAPVTGTPLEGQNDLSALDCIRITTLFRYYLPTKNISICGGREHNLRELQSWIFMAGASGVMTGNYLTTSGRDLETDMQLFDDLEVKVDG